jgi:chromosome segregation ATPase
LTQLNDVVSNVDSFKGYSSEYNKNESPSVVMSPRTRVVDLETALKSSTAHVSALLCQIQELNQQHSSQIQEIKVQATNKINELQTQVYELSKQQSNNISSQQQMPQSKSQFENEFEKLVEENRMFKKACLIQENQKQVLEQKLMESQNICAILLENLKRLQSCNYALTLRVTQAESGQYGIRNGSMDGPGNGRDGAGIA